MSAYVVTTDEVHVTVPFFLDSYLVDKNRISVSGLSSGGYFAVQFHVAFSRTLMGVGVIAGGKVILLGRPYASLAGE